MTTTTLRDNVRLVVSSWTWFTIVWLPLAQYLDLVN